MNLIKYLLLVIVLLCAFPIGFWLAKLTKEELKQGKKAFIEIIIISLVIANISIFLPLGSENKLFIITSMLFMAILSLISLKRALSYKERLRRKK